MTQGEDPLTDGNRIGVLFVHGIGEQQEGYTLSQFVEPLYTWISRWTRTAVRPLESLPASPSDIEHGTTTKDTPRHCAATLKLPALTGPGDGDCTITVVSAECWWAEQFPVPSGVAVARWAAGFVHRAAHLLRLHGSTLTNRIRTRGSYFEFLEVGKYGVNPALILLGVVSQDIVLAVAIMWWTLVAWTTPFVVAIGFICLRAIARALPSGVNWRISQWAVRKITRILGDAEVLMQRDDREEMIKRVRNNFHWLSDRVDHVVVVAHSQGARLAYEALTRPGCGSVATFVTVGGAVNLLSRASGQEKVAAEFRQHHPGARWVNFWATLDPVPAGPVQLPSSPMVVEVEICNRNSLIKDHTTYTENVEEFIAPLAELIGNAGGATLHFGLDDGDLLQAGVQARRRRVQRLASTRWQLLIYTILSVVYGWVLLPRSWFWVAALSAACLLHLINRQIAVAWARWSDDCADRLAVGDLRLHGSGAGHFIRAVWGVGLAASTVLIAGLPLLWWRESAWWLLPLLGLGYLGASEAFDRLNTPRISDDSDPSVEAPGGLNRGTSAPRRQPPPSGFAVVVTRSGMSTDPPEQAAVEFLNKLDDSSSAEIRAVLGSTPRPLLALFAERSVLWLSQESRLEIAARIRRAIESIQQSRPDTQIGDREVHRHIVALAHDREKRLLLLSDLCERAEWLAHKGKPELQAWLKGAHPTDVTALARSLVSNGRALTLKSDALWPDETALLEFLRRTYRLPRMKAVLGAAKDLSLIPGRRSWAHHPDGGLLDQ